MRDSAEFLLEVVIRWILGSPNMTGMTLAHEDPDIWVDLDKKVRIPIPGVRDYDGLEVGDLVTVDLNCGWRTGWIRSARGRWSSSFLQYLEDVGEGAPLVVSAFTEPLAIRVQKPNGRSPKLRFLERFVILSVPGEEGDKPSARTVVSAKITAPSRSSWTPSENVLLFCRQSLKGVVNES